MKVSLGRLANVSDKIIRGTLTDMIVSAWPDASDGEKFVIVRASDFDAVVEMTKGNPILPLSQHYLSYTLRLK